MTDDADGRTPGRRGLAGSAAVMFAGTLTSRVLGLVRSALLIAAIYTLGGAADAFAVANKLPNIIYMLLAGGVLNAVLVPQIVRAMRNDDGGQEYVNRLLTIAGTALAAVTVLLTAAAPILVTMYAAEFRSGPWAPVAIAFAMWCLPQLFFYGMYTLLGQILNARSVFGPYMWAPAVNNLFAIIGLVTYLVVFGSFDPANPDPAEAFTGGRIALLAGSATLGVIAQAAILVVPLARAGFRYRFRWGLRGSGLGRAGRVAWWAFLALLAGQVGYLALSNLAAAASTVAERTGTYAAGNAAWDAAFLVFMLPQSLITVSLVTAIFTRLSTHAAAGQRNEVREDLSLGLRTLGVFTVFAAGALAVLAIPVVQVVQFDVATFEAYRAVGAVLVAMAVGLPAIAIWTMTQRVYFAFEDTKALFTIQVPMAVIQIVGCGVAYLTLPASWWVVGSAVANSVSLMFGALVSYLALRRKLHRLDGARILRTYLRLTLAIVVPAGMGWGLLHLWGVQTTFIGALVRVLCLGTLMGVLYLILLRRLRVSELDQLLARIAAMAAPVTNRLAPVAARIPGLPQVRTMWGRMTGVEHGRATTMDVPPALRSGDVLAGRYRLVQQDHDGQAWLGTDTILDRQVRIHTVTTHRDSALDAARRAALVADDRLLRILRVGSHEQIGYIVTEMIQGRTLAALVAEGRLHPEQARTLVGEAAGALEVARRRGVHHLRLGPESLYRTPSGQVIITGLAVDAAIAGAGADSARTAARTDTVDLVGLLYTALTGQHPGPADRAGGVPVAPEYQGQPVPPAELIDDVPEDLDTLCAVTFGPHHDGPFTPGELVRDLAPWTDPGEGPVHAASASAPEQASATDVPGESTTTDDGDAPAQERTAGLGAAGVVGAGAAGAGTLGVGATGAYAGTTGAIAAAGGAATSTGASDASGAGYAAAGATGTTAAGMASQAPAAAPLDTSRWAPQPPPMPTRLPDFDTLINPHEPEPGAHVLDTYVARHERPTFDPALPTPVHTAPTDPAPAGTGATALRRPGAPGPQLPPTAAPPPGVAPEYGPVGAATPGAPRADAAGTVVGAAAGATGTADAAGKAGTAAAATGTAASAAGAGVASLARGTGTALRSFGSKATAATERFGASMRELTQSWRSDSSADERAEEPDAEAVGEASESAGDAGDAAPIYPAAHPTAATGMEPPDDFEDSEDLWEQDDPSERFNPTPVVILTMIAAVVVAGLLAIGTLRDARTSFEPDATPSPTAPITPTDEETEEEPQDEPEPEDEPEEPETEGPEPVVASVRSLDDNPDLAYLATDGNRETVWRSLRYNDPMYGMKSGLGFVIELEEPVVVSRVTLDVQGEGGTVQIRVQDPDSPDSGPVLAEGAMGPEVTYELAEPTETDVVVLWFPELPVADSDGRHRIELAEVSVR